MAAIDGRLPQSVPWVVTLTTVSDYAPKIYVAYLIAVRSLSAPNLKYAQVLGLDRQDTLILRLS